MSRPLVRRLATAITGVLVACLGSGCIEFDRTITLNRDLSGRATINASADLEPFLRAMLEEERKGAGESSPITQADLTDALDEWVKDFGGPRALADLRKAAPKGITVTDAALRHSGMKMLIGITFVFDDLRTLPTLEFTDSGTDPWKPFDKMLVVEEGQTLTITIPRLSATLPPDAGQQRQDATMAGLLEAAKSMRESLRLELPHTIVDTNAMRREGGALSWEYTAAALLKLPEDQRDPKMTVRIRK